jgi:hypothetical protein
MTAHRALWLLNRALVALVIVAFVRALGWV